MSDTLKNIIGTLSIILLITSILILIGTAGSVDTNELSMSAAIPRGIIWFAVLILSTAGLLITEKEEDAYGRL